MKKYILLLCFVLILIPNMLAQVYYMRNEFKNVHYDILNNINEMGIDENLLLTELEGKYFNALYQIDERKYNLGGKIVGFFTGPAGTTKSNKKEYFLGDRERLTVNDNSPIFGFLYIFDETQKKASGGYDAAIVYCSKRLVSIKDVVKNLKRSGL